MGAAAAGAATAWGQRKDQARLERIAVMSYSFDSIVQWGAHADDPGARSTSWTFLK